MTFAADALEGKVINPAPVPGEDYTFPDEGYERAA
jgi:hypothetical protein